MLGHEQQRLREGVTCLGVAGRHLLLPFAAERQQAFERADLFRVSRAAVNPGVADFVRDDRQAVLCAFEHRRERIERRADDFGVRVGHHFVQTLDRRRFAVPCGVVYDDFIVAELPAEQLRHINDLGGGVDADMQVGHARLAQQRHERNRVTRHVAHLGGDGLFAESLVKAAADR